jgi:vacuolar-type H+-ATPase subunit I/STV1
MSILTETARVTLTLPKDLYERLATLAHAEETPIEELLCTLIAEGLEARGTVREILEGVSAQYRARLAREGKLDQSPEEVLQELRDVREQIARELYP